METYEETATIEASIHKAFNELGAEIVVMTGNERIKILHDSYIAGNTVLMVLLIPFGNSPDGLINIPASILLMISCATW